MRQTKYLAVPYILGLLCTVQPPFYVPVIWVLLRWFRGWVGACRGHDAAGCGYTA